MFIPSSSHSRRRHDRGSSSFFCESGLLERMNQRYPQDHRAYGAVRRVHSFFPYNVTDARTAEQAHTTRRQSEKNRHGERYPGAQAQKGSGWAWAVAHSRYGWSCVPSTPTKSPAAWFPPPVSSPPPLVPRIPHPKFVPRGVGAGRGVCWVFRAQVSRLGGLDGDALEAGWRRASVCAHGNGYTGLGI